MIYFAVELVLNDSYDGYANSKISSLTNFLPEQINIAGEREVAITELSCPSLYQNIKEGKIFHLDETTPDTRLCRKEDSRLRDMEFNFFDNI